GDVGFVEGADVGAPIAGDDHQPLGLETPNGFAHGGAGDGELLGEALLDESGAGWIAAFDDAAADLLVDAAFRLTARGPIGARACAQHHQSSAVIFRSWSSAPSTRTSVRRSSTSSNSRRRARQITACCM